MLTKSDILVIIFKGENNAETSKDKEFNRNISHNVEGSKPTTDI